MEKFCKGGAYVDPFDHVRGLSFSRKKKNFPDPPEMVVRLGRNLDGNNIKVGDDAYLDCVIAANPPVRNLEWKHEVGHFLAPLCLILT